MLNTSAALADEPHHDGSASYTAAGPHVIGSVVRVRLRVPAASAADRVRVRSVPDGEPLLTEATIEHRDDSVAWWSAELVLCNPVTNYRFLLEGGEVGYGWVNESGLTHLDVSDRCDFRLTIGSSGPTWLDETIGYQIFLDRFATSGHRRTAPDWAIPATWDTAPATDAAIGTRQWFGGDLAGIEGHLDHLERVGVNLIYLTPFFPAESAHRYDASTFDRVDPFLGGDEALVSLIDAAHARNIRVVGDITLNHTGDRHDWFLRAQQEPDSDEADFYMFGDPPGSYVAWHDVPSLPKLDHRSDELVRRLYRGPDSVIARYLTQPFGLDGWRVDCANTTGRHGDIDLTRRIATDTRTTIEAHPGPSGTTGWLLAEHCYDASADLDADGWHGVMASQWFGRPIWSWLRGSRGFSLMSQIDLPQHTGRDVVDLMRTLGGGVSWAARNASMTMLDSHDTARFRTVVGADRDRHVVGLAALFTMPGVPTLFAGSEVGVEGDTMDTCRVPFPWDEARWDTELFDVVTRLTRLRSERPELRHGSLRWIDATDDTITYAREIADSTIVVHLRRADEGPVDVGIDALRSPSHRAPKNEPAVLFGPAPTVVDAPLGGRFVLRFDGGTSATLVEV